MNEFTDKVDDAKEWTEDKVQDAGDWVEDKKDDLNENRAEEEGRIEGWAQAKEEELDEETNDEGAGLV
jgi:hypothetical protein